MSKSYTRWAKEESMQKPYKTNREYYHKTSQNQCGVLSKTLQKQLRIPPKFFQNQWGIRSKALQINGGSDQQTLQKRKQLGIHPESFQNEWGLALDEQV